MVGGGRLERGRGASRGTNTGGKVLVPLFISRRCIPQPEELDEAFEALPPRAANIKS